MLQTGISLVSHPFRGKTRKGWGTEVCKKRQNAPAGNFIMPRTSKKIVLRAGAVVAGLLLLASLSGVAQTVSTARERVEEALRGMVRGHSAVQVAVSPDGKELAWVEEAKGGTEIRLAPLSDLKHSVRVTAAVGDEHCREEELAWAPDASALAFFSDCAHAEEQSDLYLWRLSGGASGGGGAVQLSELHGYADGPAFSPDGSRIGFLYVEGATRPAGALAAMKPWSGVVGEDGVEIQRIAAVRVDGLKPAAPQWLSPAGLHVYEFDWAPDSQGLAYVAADPPGENNWWVANLYTQQESGAPRVAFSPARRAGALHGLQMAVPRWSPDGRQIAFIGGLMSDQGSTGGDVWVMPSAGGEPVNLTPRRAASAAWIEWGGKDEIFISELAGGNAQLILLRLHGKGGCTQSAGIHGPVFSIPATVGDGRMEMSLSTANGHELFVFRAGSFDHPQEIWAARADGVLSACAGSEGGNLTQLTHWNDGLKAGWGKAESLTWQNEGLQVQGWLMQPKNYDPTRKYPLIVLVHGGPAAAETPYWGGRYSLSAPVFSALGYFVLEPNPRGSFGQGEAFTQANRRDFGHGDLRDILAGVDAVLARYPVDPRRVGLTGWSYGGFMSMFAVTQTDRFRAAVAGAGIADWQSYYGENSIDQWMLPYFGASVYDDPAVYRRSSAIEFIKNVKTPTLVVVGDRDGECPAPQSFEFWHALRALGVATQLVVYPNEGHGFVSAEHRRDVVLRAAEWFEHSMPPSEADATAAAAK
jgi:dipeptidyl aminopeptidase/acylaminoacyl peptidase